MSMLDRLMGSAEAFKRLNEGLVGTTDAAKILTERWREAGCSLNDLQENLMLLGFEMVYVTSQVKLFASWDCPNPKCAWRAGDTGRAQSTVLRVFSDGMLKQLVATCMVCDHEWFTTFETLELASQWDIERLRFFLGLEEKA